MTEDDYGEAQAKYLETLEEYKAEINKPYDEQSDARILDLANRVIMLAEVLNIAVIDFE